MVPERWHLPGCLGCTVILLMDLLGGVRGRGREQENAERTEPRWACRGEDEAGAVGSAMEHSVEKRNFWRCQIVGLKYLCHPLLAV